MLRWRVMVVDDEPDVRTIVAATLKPKYEVVEAYDGLDALEKLDRYEPDFVVIDVMMPLINGFDACAAIRRHPKFCDIPVMFLSALAEKEAMMKGYKSGANLYLTKPFEPARLIKNVELFFEKSPPIQYDKKYSIQQIEQMEAEKPQHPSIIDINTADTLFDYTIPKEASEWKNKNPKARRPVELSEDIIPTEQEIAFLKDKWKTDLEQKKSARYSFKPVPHADLFKDEKVESAGSQEITSPKQQMTPEAKAYPPSQISEKRKPPINELETREIMPDDENKITPRVMIIDDDMDIIDLIRLTLSEQFEVVWAKEGIQGIERLVSYEPDILLLDIMLPKVSGFQILQSLRRNKTLQNLIVIMISAKSSSRDMDYAYRLGANSYVVKPFAPSQIFELVKKYTGRKTFASQHKKMPFSSIMSKLNEEEEFTKSQDVFETTDRNVLKKQQKKEETEYEKFLREVKEKEVEKQKNLNLKINTEEEEKKHKKGFPFFKKK